MCAARPGHANCYGTEEEGPVHHTRTAADQDEDAPDTQLQEAEATTDQTVTRSHPLDTWRARYHDEKYIGEVCIRQPILGWGAVIILVLFMLMFRFQVSDKRLQNFKLPIRRPTSTIWSSS